MNLELKEEDGKINLYVPSNKNTKKINKIVKICGVGITDSNTYENRKKLRSYNVWRCILQRCYNQKNISYKWYGAKGVKVCDEWLYYSNFKKWYNDNYIEGFQIDKDIKGNHKLYSPKTCCFVSASVNVKESNSRRDNSCFRGEKNHLFGRKGNKNYNSKPKEHFEKKATLRSNFKKICIKQGWKFEEFYEIFAEWKVRANLQRERKYFYIYKGETNEYRNN